MTTEPTPAAAVPVCYRHPDRESHIRCQRCGRPICPDCMRDAAVGFQCPECVKEGARQTRQGRTAYGGLRPTNASTTSMVIIGINVAVWAAIIGTGWASSRLVDLLALRPSGGCARQGFIFDVPEAACGGRGTWLPGVADGAWWQLLTNAFTHVEIWHIAFNMLALYWLGPQLETVFGRTRFLALYVLSALTASATVLWLGSEYGATLGASGAIYGLLGCLLVVAHKVGGDVRSLMGLILVNALITFVVPNVSWQGHLGGFVGGALIGAVLVYAPRGRQRSAVQWWGLFAYTCLVAVVILLRIGQLA